MGYRFREKIARFLYGRYGADALYNTLLLAELVLLFLATVLNLLGTAVPALSFIAILVYVLALGLMLWAIFRFFSRNIAARRRENEAWLRFRRRLRPARRSRLPADTEDHIFRACKHCRATLRLPRQPGRHEVKCPRCGGRFKVRVGRYRN